VSGRPIKSRTREHYQSILDDHLLDTFGNRQVGAIKPKHVREWYAATLAELRQGARSSSGRLALLASAPRRSPAG
jgi:hypothetical protein